MLRKRTTASERGSIVIVALVVMIMATLAAAMVTRVASDAHGSVAHHDAAAAFNAAESALAIAQARVTAGAVGAFEDDGLSGGATWQVSAVPVGNRRWEVVAEGVSQRSRTSIGMDLAVGDDGHWHREHWREIATSPR